MNYMYVESESFTDQGTFEKMKKLYGDRYRISPLGWGNGNWKLTRKSDLLIDGVSYRGRILETYGKTRLTEKLAKRFIKDIEKGIIVL